MRFIREQKTVITEAWWLPLLFLVTALFVRGILVQAQNVGHVVVQGGMETYDDDPLTRGEIRSLPSDSKLLHELYRPGMAGRLF